MAAPPHVEVVDPSAEGGWVVRALREEGIDVVERSLDEVRGGSGAALLVLAVEVEGVLELIEQLRATDAMVTTPIVLIGQPEQVPAPDSAVAVAIDAFYARPVPVARLTRKVQTFLNPAARLVAPLTEPPEVQRPVEPTIQLSADDAPPESSWPVRENTLQLSEDAPPPLPTPTESGQFVMGAFDAGEDEDEDEESSASGPIAELSPRLMAMLEAADRRLFPDAPRLDLSISAGEESARELVPHESLEVGSPIEVLDEEADGLTFIGAIVEEPSRGEVVELAPPEGFDESKSQVVSTVGGRPAPEEGQERHRTVAERAHSKPRAFSGSATLDAFDVGERTSDGRGRHGTLADGEALGLVLRLWARRSTARLVLEPLEGSPITLMFRDGQLCSFEGPASLSVIRQLRGRGRVTDHPEHELAADAALERRIAAGQLGRFECERLLRHAREGLLFDALAVESTRFEVTPADAERGWLDPNRKPPFGWPIPVLALAAARLRFGVAKVRALVGAGPLSVGLAEGAHALFREMHLEPELVDLFERHDGADLGALLNGCSDHEGIAGALYALHLLGALTLTSADVARGDEGRSIEAVRRAVVAAARVAEDADYFTILGVERSARGREVRLAHRRRVDSLRGLPLTELGLDGLESSRQEALDALDEALAVLANPRLRSAYRQALADS